jgi:hypothetical protein
MLATLLGSLPLFLSACPSATAYAAPPAQDEGLLEPVEIRALLLRPSEVEVLGDARAIAAAMDRLAELGFGAVVPLSCEAGRALLASPALAAAGLPHAPAFPGRDVLGELRFEAHRAGLELLLGLDGTLAVDPRAASGALLLAPGSKDRPDPRLAAVRAAARAYALELARAAEIDGFVLVNGLTAFTLAETREPATRAAVEEAARELAAWRSELRAFDAGLVVGWAALDERYAPPADLGALDFVVVPHGGGEPAEPWSAFAQARPGRAAYWRALDDALAPEAFAAFLAAARARPFGGELLAPYAALDARERALADVLNQGIEAPYYARAVPPWRDGTARRSPAELVELFNDSGTFEDVDAEPPHARLAPGVRGDASWSLAPAEPGAHELYVWLPPAGGAHGELEFTVPVDPRRVQRVTLPAGEPRGWTRIARANLSNQKESVALQLAVPEGRPQGLAIGPLVALRTLRPERR